MKQIFAMKKHKLFNLVRNLRYLYQNDLSRKELDILYQAKDEAIEDCIYEFEENKELFKSSTLIIKNDEESMQCLMNCPKSFARFGDGEIGIIQGKDGVFQKYDPLLARKLLDVLRKRKDNLYVGLNRSYFMSAFTFSENNKKFYRLYGTGFRRFLLSVCDPANVYLDACCYGGYFRLPDDYDYDSLYERNKKLFKKKKIALVAGGGILSKLEHDIFEYSIERMVIPAPSVNAFSYYDELINAIKERVPSDYIICLMLGQTATVLASDLADLGYVAWDIGHMAKDYNSYMNREAKTQDNIRSFFGPDL